MVEMVVAIVVVGIVLAATNFFAYPVRQAVDTTTRAALTDAADNALQRIAREVHLALPNSVRVASNAGSTFLEFIPIRTGGRYRSESTGAACGGGTDDLAFNAADTCFKTIGPMPAAGSVLVNKDFLVFNNYGPGFDGQNAYATAGTLNRRLITALNDEGVRQAVTFNDLGTTLDKTLHDSPGKRFFVVQGNGAAPLPVSYECTPPGDATCPSCVRRWSGYSLTAAQPSQAADFGGALWARLADNVASCTFSYQPSAVGAGIGLLTLQITLSKTVSSGAQESVTLYHAVHVNNVP
jgi:MSHA biogenesis protein MshO